MPPLRPGPSARDTLCLMILQTLALSALLGGLAACRPSRDFLRRMDRSDLFLAAAIVGAVLVAHLLRLDRHSFPLVNWSMYSTVNEDALSHSVELVLAEAAGPGRPVNPLHRHPSLFRCFTPRFVYWVRSAAEDRLTPAGRVIYEDLMLSYLEQPVRASTRSDHFRLEVYLLTVDSSASPASRIVDRKLVSQHVREQGGRAIDSNEKAPVPPGTGEAPDHRHRPGP